MPGKLRAEEASPERIYELLERDDDLAMGLPFRWSEALRRGRYHKAVGEIRGVDDIAQLPVDVDLRAVGLVVHGVTTIRWLDPSNAQRVAALPGVTHDYLLTSEDQLEEARAGWLVHTREGVEVN
jgi:hypothetical protein